LEQIVVTAHMRDSHGYCITRYSSSCSFF